VPAPGAAGPGLLCQFSLPHPSLLVLSEPLTDALAPGSSWRGAVQPFNDNRVNIHHSHKNLRVREVGAIEGPMPESGTLCDKYS